MSHDLHVIIYDMMSCDLHVTQGPLSTRRTRCWPISTSSTLSGCATCSLMLSPSEASTAGLQGVSGWSYRLGGRSYRLGGRGTTGVCTMNSLSPIASIWLGSEGSSGVYSVDHVMEMC